MVIPLEFTLSSVSELGDIIEDLLREDCMAELAKQSFKNSSYPEHILNSEYLRKRKADIQMSFLKKSVDSAKRLAAIQLVKEVRDVYPIKESLTKGVALDTFASDELDRYASSTSADPMDFLDWNYVLDNFTGNLGVQKKTDYTRQGLNFVPVEAVDSFRKISSFASKTATAGLVGAGIYADVSQVVPVEAYVSLPIFASFALAAHVGSVKANNKLKGVADFNDVVDRAKGLQDAFKMYDITESQIYAQNNY